ncbi:MAG: hypothetical protein GAK31_00639 [Stenotrophomonas maltophilia]|uniref:EpsG family protein n=1 Tax=Stenotrophomonas maltophilia TaxID=40324 RepID=A0A7V8FJT5_STEMA|nr:MAG: hypothetical protein GAK31_00639 [Stenotrophomonas maltophilia]
MLVFTVAGVVLLHEIPSLWHAKFYVDGQTIMRASPALELFAGSYRGTAWLFAPIFQFLEYVGIDLSAYSTRFDLDWFLANLLWSAPYIGAIWLSAYLARQEFRPGGLFVLFCALILYAPFYGSINKDIVPALISLVFVWGLSPGRPLPAILLFVGLCCVYGLFVRSYFLLLCVMFVGTWAISTDRRKVLVTVALGSILVYFAFAYIPRRLIDIGRSEYLEGVNATRISYLFDDFSAAGFLLNRLSSLVRIAFPLELVLKSPDYAPFVVFRCYVSVLALRMMGRSMPSDVRAASSLIFAFTLTQAVFELDFGSAFRHFMMIMPVVVYLQARSGTALTRRLLPRLALR